MKYPESNDNEYFYICLCDETQRQLDPLWACLKNIEDGGYSNLEYPNGPFKDVLKEGSIVYVKFNFDKQLLKIKENTN